MKKKDSQPETYILYTQCKGLTQVVFPESATRWLRHAIQYRVKSESIRIKFRYAECTRAYMRCADDDDGFLGWCLDSRNLRYLADAHNLQHEWSTPTTTAANRATNLARTRMCVSGLLRCIIYTQFSLSTILWVEFFDDDMYFGLGSLMCIIQTLTFGCGCSSLYSGMGICVVLENIRHWLKTSFLRKVYR